jgi:hypothetical protein
MAVQISGLALKLEAIRTRRHGNKDMVDIHPLVHWRFHTDSRHITVL